MMTNHEAMERYLIQGLGKINLSLDEQSRRVLIRYVGLLVEWNRAYNLTSIRDPMEIARRHILDCLVIEPYLHGKRLLDLGTGAGLPGIVLAIARPDVECVLLDGNGKKTRFCLHVAMELKLANVEVVRARAEDYAPRVPFGTVTARAFGSLSVLWEHARRLLAPGGRLLAMKGAMKGEEGAGPEEAILQTAKIIPLVVPDLDAERHLVIVERR